MVTFPETRYATADGLHVAYQLFGDGPQNLVVVRDSSCPVDLMWEEPSLERFLARLGRFARVVCFDLRGWGASDRVDLEAVPTLETWMDDVGLVMDAAGFESAALLGVAEGGVVAILFAATVPARVSSLVLVNTFARFLRSDDYPAGLPVGSYERFEEGLTAVWGTGITLDGQAPSVAADPRFRRWWGRCERLAGSPSTQSPLTRNVHQSDVRPALASIAAPTLVAHRDRNRYIRVGHGRYLAEHIGGADYLELAGEDHLFFAGETDKLLDEVEAFVTGVRPVPDPDRVLATVAFTDIAGSTERAAAIGDRRWKELLERHHLVVREALMRFRGHEVDTAGDGFFAIFNGPARAVHCIQAIHADLSDLDLQIRAGLHTGEVELHGADVRGIAVHLGARIAASAGPGEILASRTVKDLTVGSGITFTDTGVHTFKGIPDQWQLFRVEL
jgi:class 3 adenylate cyclase